MGVGPAYAIPKILKKSGITIEDVDLFEINEAFAGQALMCVDSLKLDTKKLNPNGGAIALGHPLGGPKIISHPLDRCGRALRRVADFNFSNRCHWRASNRYCIQ